MGARVLGCGGGCGRECVEEEEECRDEGVDVRVDQHTSAYASIRQHTSAYESIREHTSACGWTCGCTCELSDGGGKLGGAREAVSRSPHIRADARVRLSGEIILCAKLCCKP